MVCCLGQCWIVFVVNLIDFYDQLEAFLPRLVLFPSDLDLMSILVLILVKLPFHGIFNRMFHDVTLL